MNNTTDSTESSNNLPCQLPEDTAQAHYCRLCPTPGPKYGDDVLLVLADMMKREAPGIRRTTMPSGYVYLGQFIDHDLTRDGLSSDVSECNDTLRPNFRTPRLDLDHLYGTDRTSARCLYDGGHLKLDLTRPVQIGLSVYEASYDDLSRDAGKAIVIDPRNDEHLILAQMHVLWSKFHNYLFDLVQTDPKLIKGVPGDDEFEQTQNLVRWHYQRIVWEDFLPHIVLSKVQKDCETHGPKLFPRRYEPSDYPIALPIEFTMAAFRFGHSMVQRNYLIDQYQLATIEDILAMTGRSGGITDNLPANYVVDWTVFFGAENTHLNRGESIDTAVTKALFELDHSAVLLFLAMQARQTSRRGARPTTLNFSPSCVNGGGKISLPCLTLTRGTNACLATGEDFAKHFGYDTISTDDLCVFPGDEHFFNREDVHGRTPLWYYLLREAALQRTLEPATAADPEPIQKLGPIGSRIVVETIYQALSADQNSIFNQGKGWKPPLLKLSNGNFASVYSMSDLIALFPRDNRSLYQR